MMRTIVDDIDARCGISSAASEAPPRTGPHMEASGNNICNRFLTSSLVRLTSSS